MGLKNWIANWLGGETLPSDARLLDVRTTDEWRHQAISGSVHIPLNELSTDTLINKGLSDTSLSIVVYCASGVRAIKAKKQLQAWGYKQVVNGGGVEQVAKKMGKSIISPSVSPS